VTAAERMRRWRERHRNGEAVYSVHVENENALIDLLVAAGCLSPLAADHKPKVMEALAAYLAQQSARYA
jgi:hypothetical protein